MANYRCLPKSSTDLVMLFRSELALTVSKAAAAIPRVDLSDTFYYSTVVPMEF